jgi:transposase
MGFYWGNNYKKRIKINRIYKKKKTYGYANRDEQKRKDFQQSLSKIVPANRVFLDETGIDNNDEYAFGWGPKGKRIYGLKKARRTQRLNIIATLNEKNIDAPFVFEGYCDQEIFNAYAEKILLKSLRPGQTVILDNASFHKSPKLEQIIKKAGCELLYLPPYSPDFNPIEKRWSAIKNSFRKLIPKYDGDLNKCASEVFSC